MGYRIEYDGAVEDTMNVWARFRQIGTMTAAFFLLFCAVTSAIWPEKWGRAKEMLIPGDSAVTKAAFSQMTQQLQAGEAVSDAVVTFCKEVVDGADLSD